MPGQQGGDEPGRVAEVGVEVEEVVVAVARWRTASPRASPSPGPSLPAPVDHVDRPAASAASSSAIWPVPSGELSSMTRIDASGANWRIVSTRGSEVAGLVVGRQRDQQLRVGLGLRLGWG